MTLKLPLSSDDTEIFDKNGVSLVLADNATPEDLAEIVAKVNGCDLTKSGLEDCLKSRREFELKLQMVRAENKSLQSQLLASKERERVLKTHLSTAVQWAGHSPTKCDCVCCEAALNGDAGKERTK